MAQLDAALLGLARMTGLGLSEAEALPVRRLVRLLQTLHDLRTAS